LHFLLAPLALASDQVCEKTSAANKTQLIELFTSDGCDSCPPANRWLSEAVKRKNSSYIPLSLHVTYWDSLGWKDRFGKTENDQLQADYAKMKLSNFVYTPEIMLNAREFQAWRGTQDINQLNTPSEIAPLSFKITTRKVSENQLQILIKPEWISEKTPSPKDGILRIYLYEDEVADRPNSGELRGVQLKHDHVARFHKKVNLNFTPIEEAISLDSKWNLRNMGVIVIAQSNHLAEIYQALDLPFCFQ
jgi:hypothetical protein